QGLGEIAEDVGSNEALLAEFAGPDLAGQPTQIDSRRYRTARVIRELRQKTGDETGEDVAGSAGSKSGGSGRIDPNLSVGKGNECALALEDQHDAGLDREVSGHTDSIVLNLGGGFAGEPGHFARVRRHHPKSAVAVEPGNQRVGIDHHRLLEFRYRGQDQRGNIRLASESRSDRKH